MAATQTVRFMLLMPWGRVGSNLLFGILRQSAPMKLANESLNRLRTAEEQRAWFDEFYEVGSNATSAQYIGSKQNVLAVRDLDAMKALLAANDIRIVRLRRDNHVKAAVSQIRAEQYADLTERESGERIWGLRKNAKPMGPTQIDPSLLLKRIGIMESMSRLAMSAFSPEVVFDVEYEEINADLDRVVHRLRDHLGVPQTPYKTWFAKATPDDLGDAITNFAEVRASLAETQYASLI